MNRRISMQIIDNPKLLSHLMEQSYWIKLLNRDPKTFQEFQKQMRILYKERASDKINNVVDSLEMITSLIDVT